MFIPVTEKVYYKVFCNHLDGSIELLDEGTEVLGELLKQKAAIPKDAAIDYRFFRIH